MNQQKHSWEEIHALWNELADFDAAQTEAAGRHLMQTLAGWLQADQAFWVGAVRLQHGTPARRDPQRGWRARVTTFLHSTPERKQRITQGIRAQDTSPAMTSIALTRNAGRFRVHHLDDGFLDLAAFKKTSYYQIYYQAEGVTDRFWVVTPVNADAESYFAFDRCRKRRRFSQSDLELAVHTLKGLKWFHRQMMLNHGLLVARAALTSAEQQLIPLLLTDKSEKEIARELKRSFHTVHRHISEIFRKFSVKGRSGFMSLWLGGRK